MHEKMIAQAGTLFIWRGGRMGLFNKFFNMTRKPEGFLGKMMVNTMNKGHGAMSDWGMEYLDGVKATNICELGCGGGKSAAKLMRRYPEAKLTAVDYSPVSVKTATELNAAEINAGRCTVLQGWIFRVNLSIWLQLLRLYISGRASKSVSAEWRKTFQMADIFS